MGAGLKEGEIVVIEGPDGRTEVGLIIEYHARGECELGLGLVWVQSGNFKQLANEFTDKLSGFRISRGETHSFITDECIARIVRQYDGNDKRSAKRPKTGLTVALPYVTAPDVSSFKGGHFHSNLELPRKFLTLHSVISALEKNDFIMSRKINQEFLSEIQLRKFLKDALKGRSEGVWMNPSVSQACLKFFGIPRAYFTQDRKLVSGYNQMIIQVDGTDTARTLGMHKDRDAADKEVNTVLGCVGGEGGKDVILWRASALSDMPRWWRNEGLGREAFRFALLQCRHIDVIRRSASVVTLEPGQFVFMPKEESLSLHYYPRCITSEPLGFCRFGIFSPSNLYIDSCRVTGNRPFSRAQFWKNVCCHWWFISDLYFFHTMSDMSGIVRILLHLLVIWVVEIVQSQKLMFIYGRNVAWDYSGHKSAKFNGSIYLGMWPEWMLRACVMEFIYYPHVVSII